MKLLLDTHTVVWWLDDRMDRLSERARGLLEAEQSEFIVSAATVWEASIKREQGRFPESAGLMAALERSAIDLLPVTPRHADRAGTLPRHHADPFDRLLVAQAQMEGLPLVTNDGELAAYGIEIVW